MTDYDTFLTRIIDDGIAAATADYQEPRNAEKLAGSLAGFEACRDRQPSDLAAVLIEANKAAEEKFRERADDYWYHRCYTLEIEWVANCVSAVLVNQGRPGIIPPTARGVMKAAEIVGVASS